MQASCEVNFIDVGQGACSIIIFGNRRGIVIDCGRNSLVPLKVLLQYVDFLDCLIISHHDWDHAGGAKDIISTYCNHPEKQMGTVVFPFDREPKQKKFREFLNFIQDLIKRNQLKEEPKRVEREWKFEKDGIELKCLAPTFWTNTLGLLNEDPNLSSAILELLCAERRVLFSGDAPIKSWENVHAKNNNNRNSYDVVMVPHHGGRLGTKGQSLKNAVRYFSQIIKADTAIISVGSSNDYGHPDKDVILAARLSGAKVMCTQITSQCTDLNQIKDGVIPPTRFALSGLKGKRGGVSCAGSIAVTLDAKSIQWGNDEKNSGVSGFDGIEVHQLAVDTLANKPIKPLCRGDML